MRKERTHYDKAFKENAVKLSIERKNVSELAHELGVDPLLLYRWRKEFQSMGPQSFPGNGVQSQSVEAKELADIKKRLYDAETERDILKKALSIISRNDR
jgi:transposase